MRNRIRINKNIFTNDVRIIQEWEWIMSVSENENKFMNDAGIMGGWE